MENEKKGYSWPASALTVKEMAILVKWRKKTGTPITKLLRQSVTCMDRERKI